MVCVCPKRLDPTIAYCLKYQVAYFDKKEVARLSFIIIIIMTDVLQVPQGSIATLDNASWLYSTCSILRTKAVDTYCCKRNDLAERCCGTMLRNDLAERSCRPPTRTDKWTSLSACPCKWGLTFRHYIRTMVNLFPFKSFYRLAVKTWSIPL